MHGAVGKVMMIESGDILEFDELGARKAGRVPVGRVCIDSGSRGRCGGGSDHSSDRRHLSEDGIVLPIIAINKLTGQVESVSRDRDSRFCSGLRKRLLDDARETVVQTLELSSDEEKADYGVIKEKIRADLKRYIVQADARRPLIMPVILEI